MKFCTNCGAELAEGFKFCSNCGTKFEETVTEELTPQKAVIEEPVLQKVEKTEIVEPEIVEPGMAESEEIDIKYEEEPLTGGVINNYNVPVKNTVSVEGTALNGNIGFSIASMVCGLLSLVCCCLWFFSIILSIAAIVLGIISLKKGYDGKGMAIAGIVTGGISIFAVIVILILGGAYSLLDM